MFFIERFIIVVTICSFLVTIGLIFYNLTKRKETQEQVEAALKVNHAKDLEDLLIVHDKDLDKGTKQKLRARIDDLVIEEDERDLCKLL